MLDWAYEGMIREKNEQLRETNERTGMRRNRLHSDYEPNLHLMLLNESKWRKKILAYLCHGTC